MGFEPTRETTTTHDATRGGLAQRQGRVTSSQMLALLLAACGGGGGDGDGGAAPTAPCTTPPATQPATSQDPTPPPVAAPPLVTLELMIYENHPTNWEVFDLTPISPPSMNRTGIMRYRIMAIMLCSACRVTGAFGGVRYRIMKVRKMSRVIISMNSGSPITGMMRAILNLELQCRTLTGKSRRLNGRQRRINRNFLTSLWRMCKTFCRRMILSPICCRGVPMRCRSAGRWC